MLFFIIFVQSAVLSSLLFLFLNKKYGLGLRHLFIDNIFIVIFSTTITLLFNHYNLNSFLSSIIINFFLVPVLLVLNIMLRVFRVPDRRYKTREGRFIVAPADGHIKYIKLNEANTIPEVSGKDKQYKLDELCSYDLTKQPYWSIGISITPFDVHKLAAPVSGKIILNRQYVDNHSKHPYNRNKRKTTVFDNGIAQIAVVQTLPGRIKRIVTYLNENDLITKGEWFGEIRFGAQIDIIIPNSYFIELNINDQVYAGKSVISYTQNKKVILAE